MASCRNPLRRSHSFAFKEGLKLKFMSRGSQPNLVAYADSEAQQDSSNKDESRRKAGNHMRNVSVSVIWHHHCITLLLTRMRLLTERGAMTCSCNVSVLQSDGPLVESSANLPHHLHASDCNKSCP